MGAPQKKECRKTRAGPYGTESGKKSDKRFRCTPSSCAVKSARRICDSGAKKCRLPVGRRHRWQRVFPVLCFIPLGRGRNFRRAVSAFRRRNFAKPLNRRSFLYPRSAVLRRPLFLSAQRAQCVRRQASLGCAANDDNFITFIMTLCRNDIAARQLCPIFQSRLTFASRLERGTTCIHVARLLACWQRREQA